MTIEKFTEKYGLWSENIAWFLGAGASVSAGIPTANFITEDLKWRIFLRHFPQHDNIKTKNPDNWREIVQGMLNNCVEVPKIIDPLDAYSEYFEYLFETIEDRDKYMKDICDYQNLKIKKGSGYLVIRELLRRKKIRLIFTTNFDLALDDQIYAAYRTSTKYQIAVPNNSNTSYKVFTTGFRPIITKLHGDFQFENLRNTNEELKTQDKQLGNMLLKACNDNGLAIMGYSGRDKSIMEILNRALDLDNPYPRGIYWFKLKEEKLLNQTVNFLDRAKQKGVNVETVEIDSFDSAFNNILKYLKLTEPSKTIPKKKSNNNNQNKNEQTENQGTISNPNQENLNDHKQPEINKEIKLLNETVLSTVTSFWDKAIMKNQPYKLLKELVELSNNNLTYQSENTIVLLESIFKFAFLETTKKTVTSPFSRLAAKRASLFVSALLLNEYLKDEQCIWLCKTLLNYMPTNGLSDYLKIVHKDDLCKYETRVYWAAILYWAYEADVIEYNENIVRLDEFKIGHYSPENDIDLKFLLNNFSSSQLIKKIHSAFNIAAWAIKLKKEPRELVESFDLILENLNKMLTKSTDAEIVISSYVIRKIITISNIYINGHRVTLETQNKLIEALKDNINKPVIADSLCRTIGLLYQTTI